MGSSLWRRYTECQCAYHCLQTAGIPIRNWTGSSVNGFVSDSPLEYAHLHAFNVSCRYAQSVPVWLTSVSCSSSSTCLSSCLASAPTATQTCSSNTYISISCSELAHKGALLVHFQLNTYSHDNLTANVHTTAYKGKHSLLGVHEVQSFEMIIHRDTTWNEVKMEDAIAVALVNGTDSLSLTRLSPNGGSCMLYQSLERQLPIG